MVSEDLATVGASAVLTAGAARAVREVLGTAGGVGAGHQGGGHGLPLRPAVARVAARHLPLRDSHCYLLFATGRTVVRLVSLWWCSGPASGR